MLFKIMFVLEITPKPKTLSRNCIQNLKLGQLGHVLHEPMTWVRQGEVVMICPGRLGFRV